jgi:hypothetical protein
MPTSRPSADDRLVSLWVATSLPVSSRPQVRLPLPAGDLVADQRVAGLRVGDAQQRFGQAHQGHAFLGGQRIFLQQALDDAGPAGRGLAFAQRSGQAPGQRRGLRRQRAGQACQRQQPGQGLRLRRPARRRDRLAQGRRRRARLDEIRERTVRAGRRGHSGSLEESRNGWRCCAEFCFVVGPFARTLLSRR